MCTKNYSLYKNEKIKVNLSFTKKDYISSGTYGDVYHYNNRCIKISKDLMQLSNVSTIKKLQSIDSSNLCKIYNLYYERKEDLNSLKAYDMEYYEPDETNILIKPMDYTIDNLSALYVLAQKVATQFLSMEDTRIENIILQKNLMVLIDVEDWYDLSRNPIITTKDIEQTNYKTITSLLFKLYCDALRNLVNNRGYQMQDYLQGLIKLRHLEISEIFKELSCYKYPIDYIKANVKKLSKFN